MLGVGWDRIYLQIQKFGKMKPLPCAYACFSTFLGTNLEISQASRLLGSLGNIGAKKWVTCLPFVNTHRSWATTQYKSCSIRNRRALDMIKSSLFKPSLVFKLNFLNVKRLTFKVLAFWTNQICKINITIIWFLFKFSSVSKAWVKKK